MDDLTHYPLLRSDKKFDKHDKQKVSLVQLKQGDEHLLHMEILLLMIEL